MELTIEIPDKDIIDLICTAFEGGINYWAEIKSTKRPPKGIEAPSDGFDGTWERYCYWYPLYNGSIQLVDAEGGEKCKPLNRETIEEGLKVMAREYPHHFKDLIGENSDATTGDVFIQCCVFGDVIYG